MTTAAKHAVRSATAALTLTLAMALLVGSLVLAAPAGAREHRPACAAATTSHVAHGRSACTRAHRVHKGGKLTPASSTSKVGGGHHRGRPHHTSTGSAGGAASKAQAVEEVEEEEALEAGEEGSEAGEED